MLTDRKTILKPVQLARLLYAVVTAAFLLVVASPLALAAAPAASKPSVANASSNNSANVQGYAADSPLQVGTIVQLTGDTSPKVAPATQKKLDSMYGVTVDPNTLALTISSSDLPNEAYVATSGSYNVIVSSQGGVIKTGDLITLSSIDGVGMKASADQAIIFGHAGASFDGKTNSIGSSELKDTTGKVQKTVNLAIIPVAISIQHNPNQKSTKAEVPNWLKRIGEAVAEKPVGALRIYLSIAITGISLIAAIVILYAGVRNSIISIGRNPLGKKTIFRGLITIILTSLVILIVGLFAVYLLLKL